MKNQTRNCLRTAINNLFFNIVPKLFCRSHRTYKLVLRIIWLPFENQTHDIGNTDNSTPSITSDLAIR